MVESAAAGEANGYSAPAFTQSYVRLRGQVAQLVTGTSLEEEFAGAFPEIEQVEIPKGRNDPAVLSMQKSALAPQAHRAQALIGQLGGWLTGLIDEQTLQQRIEAEAAVRIKQERRQPPGFRAQ
jgi:hypothetical protein